MKIIKFAAADSIDMYQFFKTWIYKDEKGCFCCDGIQRKEPVMSESVKFQIEHTYQIFDLLGDYWGNWNCCPTHTVMKEFAKKMQEEYSLEISELRHDTVVFTATRTLSEDEIKRLAEDFAKISYSDFEYEYNDIKETLATDNTAVLWWD